MEIVEILVCEFEERFGIEKAGLEVGLFVAKSSAFFFVCLEKIVYVVGVEVVLGAEFVDFKLEVLDADFESLNCLSEVAEDDQGLGKGPTE